MLVSKNKVTRARLQGTVKYFKLEKEEYNLLFLWLGNGQRAGRRTTTWCQESEGEFLGVSVADKCM